LVSVFKISVILQFVTGVLPLLLLVIYKRKLRVEFVILLLASAITTLILFITASFGIKNWFFFNFYNAIYLTCITIFYFSLLRSSPFRKYVLILSFLCGAVLIYDLTYLDIINLTLPALFFSTTTFSVFYFIDNLGKKSKSQTSKAYFIINTSICMYSSFSFFMSLELETMLANQYWIIHNVVEASSKLVIAYAILKIPKTTEEMNSKSVTLP
jgi:hypothetical protein